MPTFREFAAAAKAKGWTLDEAHGSIGVGHRQCSDTRATVALLVWYEYDVLDELDGRDGQREVVMADGYSAIRRVAEDLLDPYRDVFVRAPETVADAVDEEWRRPVEDERQALSDEYVAAAV